MAQKSGAVKALTGGIAHLFKQNKVGVSSSERSSTREPVTLTAFLASLPSGDTRQRIREGDRQEPGDGHRRRRQRAGHQHQKHPHRHRLRGHALSWNPGLEFKGVFVYIFFLFYYCTHT